MTSVRLSTPSLAMYLIAGALIGAGATAPDTVLGFAIAVGLGIAGSGWALLGRHAEEPAVRGPERDVAPAGS